MPNIKEYFDTIGTLNKNNYEIMELTYGKAKTYNFFEKLVDNIYNSKELTQQEKMQQLNKLEYFFEIEEKENDLKNKVIINESAKEIDIFSQYLNDMLKYPILTIEEEQKHGKNLKKINDITIKKEYKQGIITDLEKVFSSITNKQDKDYVFKKLENYLTKYAQKESKNDKIIIYYLGEYEKLYKNLNKIPTPKDLNNYFNKNQSYNIFTSFNEEKKLSQQELINQIDLITEYMASRVMMINSNLRLVVREAKKKYGQLDMLVMINEGNIGLMKAVDRFDVDLGYKFSTYATWWINQGITRAIDDYSKCIRVPVHKMEKLRRLKRELSRLKQKYNRELTREEIMQEFKKERLVVEKIDKDKVREVVTGIELPLLSIKNFKAKGDLSSPYFVLLMKTTSRTYEGYINYYTYREAYWYEIDKYKEINSDKSIIYNKISNLIEEANYNYSIANDKRTNQENNNLFAKKLRRIK